MSLSSPVSFHSFVIKLKATFIIRSTSLCPKFAVDVHLNPRWALHPWVGHSEAEPLHSLPSLRIATGRNHIIVTPKALAFPASSARQLCGVVSLQSVTQSLRLPITFTG